MYIIKLLTVISGRCDYRRFSFSIFIFLNPLFLLLRLYNRLVFEGNRRESTDRIAQDCSEGTAEIERLDYIYIFQSLLHLTREVSRHVV